MNRQSIADYATQAIHGKYFPHIDGIRALAVLPVVLFHILAALCPGGFAGVDVFFVISGYLITGGILRDLQKDRFTIRNFYYRRIRRIMPAYFAMIIGVFTAGCALYYAAPLMMLGDAVTAGTLFLANLHFRSMRGGYFAPQLHSQPLLHLWSLSVEEQFYLFIPLLCAIIWKFRRRLIAPALALLAVLSLIHAVRAVEAGQQNDAFYFLPFRAWELLAGSLLAMLPSVARQAPLSAPRRKIDKGKAFFATAGLLMVLIPYAILSSKTPFPGAAALSPVIGTALLIRYGQGGWVSRLLSSRPLVATGKISYSLYLWHWPVTVFWRYATYDQLYVYDYIGMFLLSLVLGYLSWKLIELPVRTSPAWSMRRSFVFAAVGGVCMVILGSACVYFKGWPNILHSQANEWAGVPGPLQSRKMPFVIRRIESATRLNFSSYHKSLQKKEALVLTRGGVEDGGSVIGALGSPRVFLMGDSHAGALRYGLDTVLREKNLAGYAVSCSSTAMFNMKLPAVQAALGKLDEFPQMSTVILAEQWLRYDKKKDESGHTELWDVQLEEFAQYIKSRGKTLLIVEDIPNHKYALNDIAARMEIIPSRKMEPEWQSFRQTDDEYSRTGGRVNTRLEEICRKTGAIPVPLYLAFKEDGNYVYFDKQNGKVVPLYRDDDHLSQAGSLRAAQFILPYLSEEPGVRTN
jgi:peptidoglycan/LPS O-acetylase OafA/YrhL